MARELEIQIVVTNDTAKQKLAETDQAINKVGASAKTTGDRLDQVDAELKGLGVSLDAGTQKATSYAQKIIQIGGATKLTAEEQKKATAAITDGIAEYERMGKRVPGFVNAVATELQGLAAANKLATVETEALTVAQEAASTATVATGGATSGLIGLTGLLGGVTLAAGAAMIAAIPMGVKYATSMQQIGASTGAGAEGAQRLQNIAVRTGVSLQAMATGANSLQERVAGGDKSALGAMNALDISMESFTHMRADEKLVAVAGALGQIGDAGQRATVAKDLFSNWQELMPVLTTDVGKFADSIHELSASQIEDLAKVDREWDALVVEVKRDITELAALAVTPIVFVVKIAWQGGTDVARFIANPGSFLTNAQLNTVQSGGYSAWTGRPGKQGNIELPFDAMNMAPKSPFGFASPETTRKEMGLGGKFFDVSTVDPDMISNARIGGQTLAEQTEATSESAIARAKKAREEMAQALLDLQEETDRVFRFIDTRNIGTGMVSGGPGKIPTQPGFLRPSIDFSGFTTFANGNARPISEQRGIFGPAKIGSKTFDAGPATSSLMGDLASSVPASILAAIQGGGSKLQAAGSAIGMTLFGRDSSLTKSITGMFSADGILGKTLSSAVPIIGSLIGPAMEGLGKLWGKIFGTAGRDAVRDFATKNGGFDALHDKLGALGADGEKLWVSLTQGVGRNNPAQAKAEIEKVTAAFEAFEKAVKDSGAALAATDAKLQHVGAITPEVKAGLQDALNAKTPQDFLAALTNVNSQLDATAQKHQHLKDLAAEYNLNVKDMGKAFAQSEVDERATKLITDQKELIDSGADATAVLAGMAKQYSDLVQIAKDSGTELPNSMKPTLQKLIDMGDLVDKDGKKLTSLDGLNFGDTLEQRLSDIKDVVNDLKHAIEDLALAFRGLPTNLPNLPSSAGPGSNPRSQVDTSGATSGPDAGGFDDPYAYQYQSHTGSIIRAAGLERFHQGGALLRQVGWKTLSQQLGLGGDERLIIGQVGEGVLNTKAMARMEPQQFHAMNRGVDPAAIFAAEGRGTIAPPTPTTARTDNTAVVRAIAALAADVRALQGNTPDIVVQIDGEPAIRAINKRWENSGAARNRSRDALGVR